MRRDVLLERFFSTLISGNRQEARQIVDELIEGGYAAERILENLFWPTLENIQQLYRHDQLSDLAHHYATRLLRMLADQMQMRLESKSPRDRRVLVICGPEEPEELAAQMASDLLEANGYEVFFGGGGVANDEIVEQIGSTDIDVLVIFGAVPSTVPATRLLIDRLYAIGVSPKIQVVVGGGIFNRAEGLAEEIGADLWANTPAELVSIMNDNPQRRMSNDQRTVGRKRRTRKSQAA